MRFTSDPIAAPMSSGLNQHRQANISLKYRGAADQRTLVAEPATFYEKAFGMSETSRPVNTASFKEILINSGSSSEKAKMATTTPIVIATRPKDSSNPAMPSLILDVPDLDKAVESVKTNGGTLLRPPGKAAGLNYAMVKDPDGNQIELVMPAK